MNRNMEKGPEFRIIGNASQEVKESVKKRIERNSCGSFNFLSEKERQSLEKSERPKTAEELALIDFANEETNRLRKEIGVTPYDIPRENFHIVPHGFGESGDSAGHVDKQLQRVFLNEKTLQFGSSPLRFGLTAVHELIHLKGHLTIEVSQIGNETYMSEVRHGLVVEPPEKKIQDGKGKHYFSGLEEALAGTFEKKSFQGVLALPLFKEERDWLMSEDAQKIIERLSKIYNFPKDEVAVVSKDGRVNLFAYYEQRQVLDYVCNQIKAEFPDEYQSFDEVLKEFLRAQFTGKLLPVARLVEKTFGKGGFRLLGEMGAKPEDGTLYLGLLKKAREEQKLLN